MKNEKQNIPQTYEEGFISVSSSRVDAIKYDGDSEILFVIFKGGKQYSYSDVTQEEYNHLINSESIGKSIQEVINSHKCTKL